MGRTWTFGGIGCGWKWYHRHWTWGILPPVFLQETKPGREQTDQDQSRHVARTSFIARVESLQKCNQPDWPRSLLHPAFLHLLDAEVEPAYRAQSWHVGRDGLPAVAPSLDQSDHWHSTWNILNHSYLHQTWPGRESTHRNKRKHVGGAHLLGRTQSDVQPNFQCATKWLCKSSKAKQSDPEEQPVDHFGRRCAWCWRFSWWASSSTGTDPEFQPLAMWWEDVLDQERPARRMDCQPWFSIQGSRVCQLSWHRLGTCQPWLLNIAR